MKITRTVQEIVTKAMLGGALLSVGMGGCEVIDITPATDEQRSSLQAVQKHDVRIVTGMSLQHNETFLVDEGVDVGSRTRPTTAHPLLKSSTGDYTAQEQWHTKEDRQKRKDVKTC